MTREVKLGLIIGITVTLVVSILLSDHLSQARADRLDSGVPESRIAAPLMTSTRPLDIALRPTPTPTPAPMPETIGTDGVTGTTARTGGVGSERDTIPTTRGAPQGWERGREATADEPEIVEPLWNDRDGADAEEIASPLGGLGRSGVGQDEPVVIDQGQRPATRGLREALSLFVAGPDRGPDRGNIGSRPTSEELLDDSGVRSRGSRAGDPVRANSGLNGVGLAERVDGPNGRWYEVQPDDSLFAIAARQLGNGHRWREIAAVNSDRVGEDGGVRSGVRLWIPGDPAKASATTPETVQTQRRAPVTAASRPGSNAANKPAPRVYEVQVGDVLSRIAARELGSAGRAVEIMELNGIEDANHIRVGQKLKLPAS